MNLVFIIKNRDNTPFMVVSTTPEGSTFKPMTEAAKEVAKFLRQEYAKTPITKPELVQTMDSSKIIEGPSPSGSAVEKKVANLASLKPETVETKNLPVVSISEVLLSEFSNEEFRNVLSFKASSFISDQTQSSFNFEIKGVRAIWDPSLSIPGTNRRGGFRCPVGTRYGGQITDRFGRSCGWGVARRIANQIADIGERLEQRDDDKRKRRLDRRNARMMRRLGGVPETGRIEGGLRGIANRLEGDAKPKPQRARGGGREFAAEVWNASNVGRVVNAARGDRRQVDVLPEAGAPSARRPQNRRRDVIPETAPTPASTPRPARRPAPAGQRRPQPRPRVAPQAENVDVLTAREASDASATEGFSPYVLRKYDEYAKRVREIRAGGGNAGMLTRREWYAINKPNLRDAWKDAHGRSAPQDFEPPTPQARRPRNNRGRRKKATTAGAARSASRKPQADDVPEPAPARPVRPKAPRAQANAKMPDLGGAGWDAINQPDGSTKWKKGNWTIELLPGENGKFRGLKARHSDDGVPVISQNYNGPQGQASLNRFLRDFENNALRVVGNDVSPQSSPDTPMPSTPPAQQARQGTQQKKSPFRKFARSKNAHGKLKIDRRNSPIGKFVSEEDRTIDTEQKAIDHIKNGGDIQKVPAKFMHISIEANSSRDPQDTNKRFRQIRPNGGAVGVTKIYFLRDENGNPTNQGWVFKAAEPKDNVGELIGWNYLAAVGILEDGAIQDGKLEASVRQRFGVIRKGTPFIMIPLAHNDVPDGAKIGAGAGGYDFNKASLNSLTDKGYPERLSNLLANFVLGVSDRHGGNAMGRIIETADGEKLAHVVPMDLGWAGRWHSKTFDRYQGDFGMDSNLIESMRRDLPNMPTEQRRETYARIQEVYRQMVVQTEKTLAVGREQFLKDALQKISKTEANKNRAGSLFDGMQVNLNKLRNIEDQIVNLIPPNQR
jgi:hypothetical protein